MTVSSPAEVAEQGTPRRSSHKAAGHLTPAQAAVLAYSEARRARGLLPLQSCGEGAAAYAAAAPTEVRPRIRSVQAHTHDTPQRRRLFKAEEARPADTSVVTSAEAPCDALAGAGVAGVDAAGEPRLHLSLRLDDTDSVVLCELLLVHAACAVEALAAKLVSSLSLRGAPTPYGGPFAPEDVQPARLARLRAPALTHDVQRMSYLGNCAELRAYMAKRGANTCSTATVRRWLTSPEAAGLADRLVAAHGVSSFADLQVDHIVSARFGGPDHPFNYFVMPRALNASFNSDVSREKVDAYMGRAVARVVTAFCAYTRAAAATQIDYNEFEQQLVLHMR